MAIFLTFLFQAIQARKMSFTIFYNEKAPFQAIKTKSSKNRKNDIFPHGLTHGFGQIKATFPTFFFQPIQARKISFTIFQNKKTPFQATWGRGCFLGYKNQKFKKSKIGFFSKRDNPWLSSKNGHFSNFFFQALQARKMSFTIF